MATIHSWLRIALFLALFSPLAACSITPDPNAKPLSPLEELYNSGLEDLGDSLFAEAIQSFTEIRRKHPYSSWARLALLRIADTHLQSGKFAQATDTYRNFLKYYPKHEQAAYARLQIGHSYYDQIPGDWWLLPPAAEKDQGNVRRAISAYREMASQFPNSPEAKIARERIQTCRSKLAEHEFYVAQFYFKRKKYKGAALRIDYLLTNYSQLGLDSQALLVGARSHLALSQSDKAKAKLDRLVNEFGKSEQAEVAKNLLADLKAPAPSPPNE